jgi:antitoxin ParD1/3/4
MQGMNISIPNPLKKFVNQQISSGRYSSVSEYVRELIRQDEKRRAQEKLEAMLLEGVRSGDATLMTNEDWKEIRETAMAKIKARRLKKV